MKKNYVLAMIACLSLMVSCGDFNEEPVITKADPRGAIVATSLMETWNVDQVDSIINTLGGGASSFLGSEYGVAVYRMIYQTVDPFGKIILASGAFAVPTGVDLEAMPLASYQHGTETADYNMASQRGSEVIIGIVMATSGYLCALPDYLGLGEGPGPHYYIHAKSEATAAIDMLRACRDFAPTVGREWDGRLFLFGYSQGGHATMATHREIQNYYGDEFTVTGSAPMAGPYDCSGVQEAVIVGYDPYPTPGYLPYVIFSYNYIYHIVDDPTKLLKPPYDSIIPPMFDGTHSIGEINNVSNPVPRYMIVDSVMEAYEADPNHPLKLALRDNDLYDWIPKTPVKMFYCSSDDQVNYQNTIVAYNHFIAAGATTVSIFETANNLNHGDCALPTMLFGKFYMDSLKALPH
ncbi:MAG: hypothetical protein IPN95_03105 [Bacteroidetes bacterium]|nr:hypothetical protein [Bacteroidota bacterium]